jgi:hypothetical protein
MSFVKIVLVFGIIVSIIIMLGIVVFDDVRASINYIQCCDGKICSDVYYTREDNLCHLSLCEHNLLFGKNCTYEGANKTIIGEMS